MSINSYISKIVSVFNEGDRHLVQQLLEQRVLNSQKVDSPDEFFYETLAEIIENLAVAQKSILLSNRKHKPFTNFPQPKDIRLSLNDSTLKPVDSPLISEIPPTSSQMPLIRRSRSVQMGGAQNGQNSQNGENGQRSQRSQRSEGGQSIQGGHLDLWGSPEAQSQFSQLTQFSERGQGSQGFLRRIKAEGPGQNTSQVLSPVTNGSMRSQRPAMPQTVSTISFKLRGNSFSYGGGSPFLAALSARTGIRITEVKYFDESGIEFSDYSDQVRLMQLKANGLGLAHEVADRVKAVLSDVFTNLEMFDIETIS